jgi:hypothetical protein
MNMSSKLKGSPFFGGIAVVRGPHDGGKTAYVHHGRDDAIQTQCTLS